MEECILEKSSYERMHFTISLLIEECFFCNRSSVLQHAVYNHSSALTNAFYIRSSPLTNAFLQ